MKQIAPFFLLFIMTLNVTLPLVEQLRGGAVYEMAEDVDEKGKTENEESKEGKIEGKEKEALSFLVFSTSRQDAAALKRLKKALFLTDERLISELFASLPELPPKA